MDSTTHARSPWYPSEFVEADLIYPSYKQVSMNPATCDRERRMILARMCEQLEAHYPPEQIAKLEDAIFRLVYPPDRVWYSRDLLDPKRWYRYKERIRHFVWNLATHEEARKTLEEGDFDQLVQLSPQELCPSLHADRKPLDFAVVLGHQAPDATCSYFRCSNCGQRKTTYNLKQTRSADEPMTAFIHCVHCGNRWTDRG